MFGNGIGSLNVYVRDSKVDRKIWGLTGDAGTAYIYIYILCKL